LYLFFIISYLKNKIITVIKKKTYQFEIE
jgi:hypothetical protein